MQRDPAFEEALKKPGRTPGFFMVAQNVHRSGNEEACSQSVVGATNGNRSLKEERHEP